MSYDDLREQLQRQVGLWRRLAKNPDCDPVQYGERNAKDLEDFLHGTDRTSSDSTRERHGSITCTEMFLNSGLPAINIDAEDDFDDWKVATILLSPDRARSLSVEIAMCLWRLGQPF